MQDLKKLKFFLISRFMQIVVVTAIAEAIIFYVLSRTVFKGLLIYFFGTDDIAGISVAEAGVALLLVLAGTIISLIGVIVPKNMLRPLEMALGAVDGMTKGLFRLPESMDVFSNMRLGTRLLLTGTLVATIVVILIPYAVAAVHFSYIVMREFRAIEEQERAERDEYERRRNLLLSDIAHDLRTPMTTIAGYARALDDDLVSDERRREIYAAIQAKSDRMNDLINLLFDYVKLDSDGYSLSREDTDICELVRESVAYVYQDIEDAGMEADIDIPDEAIMVSADRVQMSRVVTNLIVNAIRHNAPGSRIGIYVVPEEQKLRIMICDSGELIEAGMAEHIFEPFVTCDESRSTRGGSGLGLSIASKIVSMHGYKIRLVQKPDTGAYKQAAPYTKMFMITITLDIDI